MALPIKRPQLNTEEHLEVSQKPESSIPEEVLNTPTRPSISFGGASLDIEEELRSQKIAKRKEEFGEAQIRGEDTRRFTTAGTITSDDLLNNPWSTYEILQDKVVEVKNWLQDVLSEQNRTSEIGEARSKRGQKYQDMSALIEALLVTHFTQQNIVQGTDAGILMSLIKNEILGLGPIEPLWRDPRITEIMVNGPHKVYIEIQGKILFVPGAQFRDANHLLDISQQILAPINKTIDSAHALEDGRLSDGSRVNITHPEVGPAGPFLTIRRFPETAFTFKQLIETKAMSPEVATEVGNLIHFGCSTIISGGTGSGKTSTLNALSGCIPDGERIITIEDTLELRLHPERHFISMEARKAQHGKSGSVPIRDLVKNALRQRPDRIVVGEVRDGAAYDMLQAMNTGHDGSMTTVHANDAYGAIERLVNLISEVGEIDSNRALSLLAGGVDVIVTIERYEDGSRRTSGVYEIPNRVTTVNGVNSLTPIPLYEFVQDGLDENDKIYGHYEKLNELSDSMKRKHRLDKREPLTLEALYELTEYTV